MVEPNRRERRQHLQRPHEPAFTFEDGLKQMHADIEQQLHDARMRQLGAGNHRAAAIETTPETDENLHCHPVHLPTAVRTVRECLGLSRGYKVPMYGRGSEREPFAGWRPWPFRSVFRDASMVRFIAAQAGKLTPGAVKRAKAWGESEVVDA